MSAVFKERNGTLSLDHINVQVNSSAVETYSYVEPEPRVPSKQTFFSPLPLFELAVDGERKRLRTPLMIHVSREDGTYTVENEALKVFGHGDTIAAAIEALSQDVAYYWHYYGSLNDGQVARDGVALKQMYGGLFAA